MHCETSSAWPTAAASALLAAFPDMETDVNKNGLTAQQTFDQDIDAEEPAAGKPDQGAQSGAASEKRTKRDQFGASEEFVDNAAAARAGKTCSRSLDMIDTRDLDCFQVLLLTRAPSGSCDCTYEEEIGQAGAGERQRAESVRVARDPPRSARSRVLGLFRAGIVKCIEALSEVSLGL